MGYSATVRRAHPRHAEEISSSCAVRPDPNHQPVSQIGLQNPVGPHLPTIRGPRPLRNTRHWPSATRTVESCRTGSGQQPPAGIRLSPLARAACS